jgi:uncharacterized damage-inducible protein DinB
MGSAEVTAEILDRYAAGPELLEYAAQGLSDEMVQARPGPGSWSIAELLAHMADSDVVAADRMKRVIAEEEPSLLAYDENAWIARLQGQEMPPAESLALFRANRVWMSRILARCTPADFARAGIHSESGRKTLADLVVAYVNHLDHHLKYLYGKRANLGVSIYPRYSGRTE